MWDRYINSVSKLSRKNFELFIVIGNQLWRNVYHACSSTGLSSAVYNECVEAALLRRPSAPALCHAAVGPADVQHQEGLSPWHVLLDLCGGSNSTIKSKVVYVGKSSVCMCVVCVCAFVYLCVYVCACVCVNASDKRKNKVEGKIEGVQARQ